MFCTHCGAPVEKNSSYCSFCGVNLDQDQNYETNIKVNQDSYSRTSTLKEEYIKGLSSQISDTFSHATLKINSMVGEKGNFDLNLWDVFSAVLKRHSKEEGEILFTSGTKLTTPNERDISTSWPKPWLFSRVFVLTCHYLYLFVNLYIFLSKLNHPSWSYYGWIVYSTFFITYFFLGKQMRHEI